VIMRFLPLLVVLGIGTFLYVGLSHDPSVIPSPLIDKPAPVFSAERLVAVDEPAAPFDSETMDGSVWLLNVWASWCGPCIQEHPQLIAFAAERDVPLVGLNYKDQPADARAWLARHGDPFDTVISDVGGDVGLDFGVYGVPETFVIDAEGRVRYKHVGPLDRRALDELLLPAVDALTGVPATGAAS